MVSPRPRRARRTALPTRLVRVVAPLALLGLGTTGVALAAGSDGDAGSAAPALAVSVAGPAATPELAEPREQRLNRSSLRAELAPTAQAAAKAKAAKAKAAKAKAAKLKAAKLKAAKAKAEAAPALRVVGSRYATADLNVRSGSSAGSDVVTVARSGTRVKVTGTVRDGFRYVSWNGTGRWVTNRYLATKKPEAKATAKAASGVTSSACGKGSAMESGLTPDAVLVHRTLCARFPQISSFGGTRGGEGFHATGQAVDCMISDSGVGWQVARWVRANAARLGVSEVIYSQKIWTVQRSGEGWRSMSDRGSATANHYDHVHVSVYGNRATG